MNLKKNVFLGHGTCECGECKCSETEEGQYSGKFCEDCPVRWRTTQTSSCKHFIPVVLFNWKKLARYKLSITGSFAFDSQYF